MKTLLSLAVIFFTPAAFAQEVYQINVNKLCAAIVGIPYASDNFSDEEWEKFKTCVRNVKTYQD
jgi:hypothetical protein